MTRKLQLAIIAFLTLLLFFGCVPAGKPEAIDVVDSMRHPAAATYTPVPVTENGSQPAISPLPSNLMFVVGESSGAYWIDIVTKNDELPCANYRLVANLETQEEQLTAIDIEGITLDGFDCLEALGPASTRLELGLLAGETELRFRYRKEEDVYRLAASPGFLTIEVVTASFTHAEFRYWDRLPTLNLYSPFGVEWEHLEADMLLFYTSTAWNETDGRALRLAANRVFDQVRALGAQPFSAGGPEYSVLYPTPPLGAEQNPTHIIRYFRYEGPFDAVKALLRAHDEIKMNVYSRERSNARTPTPSITPTRLTPTPSPTKTLPPPTPTSTPTPNPGPVSISPSKELYEEGEPVIFTITNHLAQPIYYRYGACLWPVPIYIGSYIEVTLKVEPLEPEPKVASLPPEESVTCTWDGKVYQRPEWSPPDSLILKEELAPAPRGQYQLRLNYALSPEEIAPKTWTAKGPLITRSPVFTIFGPYLEVEISHETRVELEAEQEAYAPGNPVHFSVTNRYERSIYYTFGCAAPVVFHFSGTEPRLEQRDAVLLTLRVPDDAPDAMELKPGETHRCRWDQKAWQDPAKEGRPALRSTIPLSARSRCRRASTGFSSCTTSPIPPPSPARGRRSGSNTG